MARRDPLENPRPLIRGVYAYVAMRLGPGPDADDVTSDVFERAVRYRASFDGSKGTPMSWLIGIARHCIDDNYRRPPVAPLTEDYTSAGELDVDALRRLALEQSVANLPPRDRDLVTLRYVLGLSTKEVAAALELTPGAVDVAVHRACERVRADLSGETASGPVPAHRPSLASRA
jgi:RNA polymerase sigma-70 factor (ECF subfamily)